MAFDRVQQIKFKWFDANNNPASGWLVNTFEAGLAGDPVDTYSDNTGTLNDNPVVLDDRGEANIYLSDNIAYKFIITNPTGGESETQDNITSTGGVISGGGSGPSGLVGSVQYNFDGTNLEGFGEYSSKVLKLNNDNGDVIADFSDITKAKLSVQFDTGLLEIGAISGHSWLELGDTILNSTSYNVFNQGLVVGSTGQTAQNGAIEYLGSNFRGYVDGAWVDFNATPQGSDGDLQFKTGTAFTGGGPNWNGVSGVLTANSFKAGDVTLDSNGLNGPAIDITTGEFRLSGDNISYDGVNFDVDNLVSKTIIVDGGLSEFRDSVKVTGDTESDFFIGDGSQLDNVPYKYNQDFLNIISGTTREVPVLTLVKDGGLWYADVEADGGGDIECFIGGVDYVLNCTTGSGVGGKARSPALTLGTISTPLSNYVWMEIEGGEPVIKTGPDINQDAPLGVGNLGVYSLLDDASTLADGALYYQRFNNSSNHPDQYRGLIDECTARLRVLGPQVFTGLTSTAVLTGTGITSVGVSVGSGVVYQLHRQNVPAYPVPNEYYVINDPVTPFKKINDLNEITTDALGNSLFTNGTYWGLDIAVSVSSQSLGMRIFISLPNGTYSNASTAISDVSNYGGFNATIEQAPALVRISRLVLGYSNASGGTISNALSGSDTQDRRNWTVGSAGGGGGSSSGAAGLDTQVQFNTGGILDANSGFTFDGSRLSVTGEVYSPVFNSVGDQTQQRNDVTKLTHGQALTTIHQPLDVLGGVASTSGTFGTYVEIDRVSSNTLKAGPHLFLNDSVNARASLQQLNVTGGLDTWMYDSSWFIRSTLSKEGDLTAQTLHANNGWSGTIFGVGGVGNELVVVDGIITGFNLG